MRLRFYIDPETGQPHIYNHQVSEAEVDQVLRNAGEDRPGRDGSRAAIGRTLTGRLLRVICVPDPQPDSTLSLPRTSCRVRLRRHIGADGAGSTDETVQISPRLG
jgi:hypothetical protein